MALSSISTAMTGEMLLNSQKRCIWAVRFSAWRSERDEKRTRPDLLDHHVTGHRPSAMRGLFMIKALRILQLIIANHAINDFTRAKLQEAIAAIKAGGKK